MQFLEDPAKSQRRVKGGERVLKGHVGYPQGVMENLAHAGKDLLDIGNV